MSAHSQDPQSGLWSQMAPSHSCLHGPEVSKTAEGQQSGVVQAAMLLIVACTWFLRVSRLREMWNLEMKFQETHIVQDWKQKSR